ncbi:hypothetical protein H6F93_14370, partial [Leptolyngbya sp. FACHB-671]|nr:hypothetical protein [Leptolyngbya sp. FACHB-671]
FYRLTQRSKAILIYFSQIICCQNGWSLNEDQPPQFVLAIAAEIWQGQQKVAVVPPVHCVGMVPSQVHQYVGKILSVLETRYGIKKFASQTRLDPELCAVRPCPLHN